MNIDANKRLEENIEEKERLKKRYLDNLYIQNLAKMIEIEGFYRLERRYIISKLLYSILGAFEEIERRKGLQYNDILLMTPDELQRVLIEGITVDLLGRKRYSLFYGKSKNLNVFDGTAAIEFAQKLGIMGVEEEKTGRDVKAVVEGTTASFGLSNQRVILGTAVVVRNKEDFQKIAKGTILVAAETTPDYVPLFKMVKAVVTEHGGITSHAAIVSRELGLPRIVAAKGLLSKVNDGDSIELDIVNGRVRRI
ncbi:MAG: PEP-utilizing enzyme [Candidatus Micrarchaeia archaeon]